VSESPLILVIEDEYLLQADIEKVLTDAGFGTEIVSSGEEALTLLMGSIKQPSVLVTDVKLAGRLTGWEVAKRIREKDPSFPIIYVTAYHQDWPAHGVPKSIVIPKPFATAQLVTAISNGPGCVKRRRCSVAIEQVIRSGSFWVATPQAPSNSQSNLRTSFSPRFELLSFHTA